MLQKLIHTFHHIHKEIFYKETSGYWQEDICHCYHLSKFCTYALLYCIGVFLSLTSLCLMGSSFFHSLELIQMCSF